MISDPLGEVDPVRRVGRMRRLGLSVATIAARIEASEDEIRRLVAEAAERRLRRSDPRPAAPHPAAVARMDGPTRREKYTRRGVGIVSGTRPAPPLPTNAPPGSAEKIQILAQRAADGFQLHHQADAA